MLKCPNCDYTGIHFQTERRPNGYTTCMECNYKAQTGTFIEEEVESKSNPARVGMKLYGYCQGYFGRDTYGTKTIEAVGRDWLVVRFYNGAISVLHDDKIVKDIPKEWLTEEQED